MSRPDPRPDDHPSRHAPKCEQPPMVFDQQIAPHLPYVGRCPGCGAITVVRTVERGW